MPVVSQHSLQIVCTQYWLLSAVINDDHTGQRLVPYDDESICPLMTIS